MTCGPITFFKNTVSNESNISQKKYLRRKVYRNTKKKSFKERKTSSGWEHRGTLLEAGST